MNEEIYFLIQAHDVTAALYRDVPMRFVNSDPIPRPGLLNFRWLRGHSAKCQKSKGRTGARERIYTKGCWGRGGSVARPRKIFGYYRV